MAQGYKDLEVYQLAHRLAVEVHKASMTLPRFELYEEGSQLRRAAASVPANIVEGFDRRRHKGDFIRFLIYATRRAMRRSSIWSCSPKRLPCQPRRVPTS